MNKKNIYIEQIRFFESLIDDKIYKFNDVFTKSPWGCGLMIRRIFGDNKTMLGKDIIQGYKNDITRNI